MEEDRIKPISPTEALKLQTTTIPDFVIDVVNGLLALRMTSKNSTIHITQAEIITGCKSKTQVFDMNWLNFENLYRQSGWKVEYDKPGYNESYGAFFIFKMRD